MKLNGNHILVKIGTKGLGQVAVAAATLVVQGLIMSWLEARDIEKSKPKPIRGFQKTPLS